MADHTADDTSPSPIDQGIKLLREATELLCSAASGNNRPATTTSTSNANRAERITSNLRTLFASYDDGLGSSRRPAPQSRNQFSAPPRKKGKYAPMFFKPRETWTHEFLCLSYSQQEVVPSKEMKWKLQAAGLGKKKICFSSKANATELKRKLEEVYPKLATGGGFELLRRGMSNELVMIDPPPNGYSVPFLRDIAGLGQAIAFLRPIQCNLDMTPCSSNTDNSLESGQNAPKVQCINCCWEIPVTEIRKHQQSCQSASSNKNLSEEETADVKEIGIEKCLVSSGNLSQTETTGKESKSNDISKLKEMFPSETEATLTDVLDISLNVEDAIDTLVNKTAVDDSWEPPPMLQSRNVSEATEGMPADDILKTFKESVIKHAGPTMAITFNRSKKAIRELCRVYKNSSGKLSRPPVVYFISSSGEDEEYEEEAADVGGPLKEFLTLATETLLSSSDPQLFEGDDDHKLPLHSQQLVLHGYFRMVGEIMAHAIIHGQVWITGLAKPVKEFMSTGCAERASQLACLEDVPDLNVRGVLQRMDTSNEDDITSLNSEDMVTNLMGESGVSAAVLTVHNVAQVAYEIMVYQVVHKRIRELEEMRNGLEALQLGTLLNCHPTVTSLVFPTVNEAAIDADVLLKRVAIDPTTTPSTRNNTAYMYLLDYLGKVCKRTEPQEIGIKSVLSFITGSPLLPKEINIQFLPEDSKHFSLPDPDTCTRSLKIPTCHTTYEKFQSAFDATVRVQGKGYGRA